MVARKITLDSCEFATVGAATTFFSEMLNRYPMGARVSDADAIHLTALLKLHSEREEKIGDGIAYFEVDKPPPDAPPFSKRCFWLVRKGGSRIDVSYTYCLKAKPTD
jgi:hypothetical protein